MNYTPFILAAVPGIIATFFLAQVETILQAADHAEKASDRWLFIALLIIGMFTIGFIVKWFIVQLDKRDTKIETLTKEVGQVRGEFTNHLLASVRELQTILVRNSDVIEANTKMHSQIQGVMERMGRAPAPLNS